MAAVAAVRKIKEATIGNPDGDGDGSQEEAQTSAIDAGRGSDAFFAGLRERMDVTPSFSDPSTSVVSAISPNQPHSDIPVPKRSQAYKQTNATVVPVDASAMERMDQPGQSEGVHRESPENNTDPASVSIARKRSPKPLSTLNINRLLSNSFRPKRPKEVVSVPLSMAVKLKTITKRAKKQRGVINPETNAKRAWDVFVGILVVYSVIAVPYRIGFDVGITSFGEAFWEFFVDIMFLSDMALTFFEAYFKDEELVYDLKKIRWHYVKTWFIVDLVSSIPLDLILGLMSGGLEGCDPFPYCGVVESDESGQFDGLENLKLFKTLKLVRLLKLARLLKLIKLATSVSVKELIPGNLMTILSLLFKIVYVAHFIACFWYMVSGVTEEYRVMGDDGLITVPCYQDGDEDTVSWVTTTDYAKFDMCDVPWTKACNEWQNCTSCGALDDVRYGNDYGYFYTSVVPAEGTFSCTDAYFVENSLMNADEMIEWRTAEVDNFESVGGSNSCFCRAAFSMWNPRPVGKYVLGHYVTSMYWVIATMMAVGYGDIYAQNPTEKVFSIMVQIVGAFMFGMIIATVTTIIENTNPRGSAMTRRIEDMKQYMRDRHVPKQLQKKIKEHYEYYYSRKSVFKQHEILREMPGHMRNRVVMYMYKDIISKIDLFQHVRDGHQDIAFIVDIAQHFQPHCENIGGILLRQGDVVDEMVFLQSGKLECFRDIASQPVLLSEADGKLPQSIIGKLANRGKQHQKLTLVNTKPVVHGYINEGYHALSYNCIFQTPSQIGLKATSTCHLLSVNRQFLLDLHVLHTNAHFLLQKEAEMQENAINKAIKSEPHEMGDDTLKSTLCINYKAVKTKDFTAGDFKLTRDFASEVKHSQIRTRRENPVDKEDPLEGLEEKRDLRSRCIIDPNATVKIQWDMFVGFLIVLTCLMLPYVMAFPSNSSCDETDPWLVLDWIVDILFVVDITVNFRTAVYDESSELYDTRVGAIAGEYFSGWFVIDLPSSLPITQLLELMTSPCNDATIDPEADSGSASSAKLIKLIRMARLIRLMKLARVLKLGKSFGAFSEILEMSLAFRRFMTLTFSLCIVAHYFGCIWHIVKHEVLTGDADSDYEPPTPMGPDHAYLTGIYWAFTTMTTVGYGDISPETVSEQLYAIVVMLVGATVFGYIVGSVASLKRELMSSSAKVGEKTSIIMNFLEEQGVSKQISRSVRLHYEYYYAEKSPYDEKELIARLPFKLKRQLLMVVNKDVLRFIPIFDKRNSDFICTILPRLKPQLCVARQFVTLSGSNSHEIHFMVMGKAQLINEHTHSLHKLVTMSSVSLGGLDKIKRKKANNAQVPTEEDANVLASGSPAGSPAGSSASPSSAFFKKDAVQILTPGDFFGHESLLFGMKQTYSVKTIKNCGFYVLHKMDVGDISVKHPYFARELEDALELSILRQTKKKHRGSSSGAPIKKKSVDLNVAVSQPVTMVSGPQKSQNGDPQKSLKGSPLKRSLSKESPMKTLTKTQQSFRGELLRKARLPRIKSSEQLKKCDDDMDAILKIPTHFRDSSPATQPRVRAGTLSFFPPVARQRSCPASIESAKGTHVS